MTASYISVSEGVYEKSKVFQKTHSNPYDLLKRVPCGSEKISYILSPTGIGIKVEVLCRECGANKDITEYEKW